MCSCEGSFWVWGWEREGEVRLGELVWMCGVCTRFLKVGVVRREVGEVGEVVISLMGVLGCISVLFSRGDVSCRFIYCAIISLMCSF